MARKITCYYKDTDKPAATDADHLIIEISNHEIVCLVKGSISNEVEGFEMFRLDKGTGDWSDAFYEVRSASQLLNRSYRITHCYYNFEEAVIIPEHRFSATTAEDFLNLLFGEDNRKDTKHDAITANAPMVNAYRVRKSINELMNRHFVLYKAHHIYSRVLEEVLSREELPQHFVKVQFYSHHIIAVVLKDRQLQLIQSFNYAAPEDIVYHIANIIRQFSFEQTAHLEISGMFEKNTSLQKQLQPFFASTGFDEMLNEGIFKTSIYPAHYFTPFYKLVV